MNRSRFLPVWDIIGGWDKPEWWFVMHGVACLVVLVAFLLPAFRLTLVDMTGW